MWSNSARTIARYDQAWEINSKIFLRHPKHAKVMSNDNSVISIICRSFPSPDWDHKRHIISKTQKAHDKAFIEAMCASFVFASIVPSIERKSAPKNESKLAAYDAFTPIMASRCEQAATMNLANVSHIFVALRIMLIM